MSAEKEKNFLLQRENLMAAGKRWQGVER